ncbi:MAG TPA: hypothetical protein ENK23_00455 [Sorangium sp.]|nr:hypothetical protein [Sorangium sp.]
MDVPPRAPSRRGTAPRGRPPVAAPPLAPLPVAAPPLVDVPPSRHPPVATIPPGGTARDGTHPRWDIPSVGSSRSCLSLRRPPSTPLRASLLRGGGASLPP